MPNVSAVDQTVRAYVHRYTGKIGPASRNSDSFQVMELIQIDRIPMAFY